MTLLGQRRISVRHRPRTDGGAVPHLRPAGCRGPDPGHSRLLSDQWRLPLIPEPLHRPWHPGHQGPGRNASGARGPAVVRRFARQRRLDRKTNKAPEKGSSSSSDMTRPARPSRSLRKSTGSAGMQIFGFSIGNIGQSSARAGTSRTRLRGASGEIRGPDRLWSSGSPGFGGRCALRPGKRRRDCRLVFDAAFDEPRHGRRQLQPARPIGFRPFPHQAVLRTDFARRICGRLCRGRWSFARPPA